MLVTNNGKSIYLDSFMQGVIPCSVRSRNTAIHGIKDLRGGVLARVFGIKATVTFAQGDSTISRWVLNDPQLVRDTLIENNHPAPAAISRSMTAAAFDYIVKLPGRIFSTPGLS